MSEMIRKRLTNQSFTDLHSCFASQCDLGNTITLTHIIPRLKIQYPIHWNWNSNCSYRFDIWQISHHICHGIGWYQYENMASLRSIASKYISHCISWESGTSVTQFVPIKQFYFKSISFWTQGWKSKAIRTQWTTAVRIDHISICTNTNKPQQFDVPLTLVGEWCEYRVVEGTFHRGAMYQATAVKMEPSRHLVLLCRGVLVRLRSTWRCLYQICRYFLIDRPWILPLIKVISYELHATFYVPKLYLLGPKMHCPADYDVITRTWTKQETQIHFIIVKKTITTNVVNICNVRCRY